MLTTRSRTARCARESGGMLHLPSEGPRPLISTPVVLIAFNRPHLARRTLAAVRDAAPQQLFLVADGPRADRVRGRGGVRGDQGGPRRGRLAVRGHTKFSEVNLGVEANVELGLDWVFGQVPEALVLRGRLHPGPDLLPVRRGAARAVPRGPRGSGTSRATGTAYPRGCSTATATRSALGQRLGLGYLGGPLAAAPRRCSRATTSCARTATGATRRSGPGPPIRGPGRWCTRSASGTSPRRPGPPTW